jgi:hypothetical protein
MHFHSVCKVYTDTRRNQLDASLETIYKKQYLENIVRLIPVQLPAFESIQPKEKAVFAMSSLGTLYILNDLVEECI